jgi:class 3 adenylate cyclase
MTSTSLWGASERAPTVSIAKRICDLAEPDQVLVSEAVPSHVVGSGLNFEDSREHTLKGLPGGWRLYALSPESRRAACLRDSSRPNPPRPRRPQNN